MPFGDPVLVARPTAGRTFRDVRRVRLADASPSGRLRTDALLRFLQDVADDDTRDAAFTDAAGWVVRRSAVEVARFPVLGEDVELTTWCSGTGGRWAERRTSVVALDGTPAIEAVTTWVHVDAAGRPTALPPSFFARYGPSAGGRTVRARLHHAGPPDAGAGGPGPALARRPWPLRIADLDVLGHVNNAAAWVPVEEELARRDLRAPLRIEVEHHRPIDGGDAVTVLVADHDDGVSLWLTVGGEVALSAVARRWSVGG